MKKREYKYEWDVLYVKCNVCGVRKNSNEFGVNRTKKFWIQSECKECHRLHRNEYHCNCREKENERCRIYYKSNRDKLISLNKERYILNIDKAKDYGREYRRSRSKNLWFNRDIFHHKAKYFINDNWIHYDVCTICWCEGKIEMHHPSYNSFDDWSRVVFCCRSCHKLIHSGILECPEPIDLLNLTK